jgi:hypothetical protein
MKRVALFLLTLALVAGFVGCGGGDDGPGDEFNMNGTWLVTAAWIHVDCDWELTPSFEWSVVQDGTTLTITEDGNEVQGSFNPRTGFFNLTQDVWDVHIELSGTMTSDTSFQAILHAARTRDNCSGEAALGGELLHR